MKTKIPKELPLEFQKINFEKLNRKKHIKSKASINFYQTYDSNVDFFYKPISKLICFDKKY